MFSDTTKPLKIIVTLSVVTLTLMVAYQAYNYLRYTLPPEQVSVSISYSTDINCRKDSPLYMLITNDSYRRIINTSFSLYVKKKYDNDSFLLLLKKVYSTDKVIDADSAYGGCWSFPELNTRYYVPGDLIYEIKQQQVTFDD
ncbi:MAG: hypothetical protein IMF15_04080 [Proteobacteria bacterium]|nr:hypothetical protein [Pseudomonadota bacterium]